MRRDSESILRSLVGDIRQRIFRLERKGGHDAETAYLRGVLKTLGIALKGGDEHGVR